jgi:hypothetical protein
MAGLSGVTALSSLLLPRNPSSIYAPPQNGLPGFDPEHLANGGGIVQTKGFSALATPGQGQLIDLITGVKSTISGSTTTGTITPFGAGATTTSTGRYGFSFSNATRNVTLGAIIYFGAVPSAIQDLILWSTASVNTGLAVSATGNFTWIYNTGSTFTSLAVAVTAGHTYFVAISFSGVTGANTGQFICVDLTAGTKSQAVTFAPTAASVSYTQLLVGNGAGSGAPLVGTTYVLAAMGNFQFLKTTELEAWANDPWSYWYPRRFVPQMMAGPSPARIFAGSGIHDGADLLVRQMNKIIMVPYW